MFGGSYVNDFIDRGRVKKVYVQAESQFRMLPQDIAIFMFVTMRVRWCLSSFIDTSKDPWLWLLTFRAL